MQIVGRKKELAILDKVLNSNQAEFVAVYGRRRVGKTYLIKHAIAKKGIVLECSGMKEGNLKEQLYNFTKQFSNTFYPGITVQSAKDWREALELLTLEIKKMAKTKKVVIFLDELPWLAGKKSKLIQNLDYFWNTEWSHIPNCKLIVCGSAASWMLNNLINAKGGLYNRITKTILLRPFNLHETKSFLENKKIKLDEKHIIELYMVMGGIPFYLNQLDRTKSISENINALCFEPEGLLYGEFSRLFKSLFGSAEIYVHIIKEVAKYHYGISFAELVDKTKIKAGGRLKERLNELEACGFIKKFLPYNRTKRDSYYKIIDEYTLFYLKWINEVEEGKMIPQGNYWNKISKSPSYYSWAGYTFENIVFKHVDKVIVALGLETMGCLVNHWQYNVTGTGSKEEGAQIDLLIDRDDNAITICEIKYSTQPFIIDKSYAKILLNKLEVFEKNLKRPKQLFLAMITASGLKKNVWSEELINKTVEIRELFK